MEQYEFLRGVVAVLERLAIPYRITGSMASMAYGEPRLTIDVDIVARLEAGQVDAFCDSFPTPDFYTPREAALQAVRDRFQFNVVHLPSGLKLDVILASDSAFDEAGFARGRRLPTGGEGKAWFTSPEDVIL